MTFSSSSPPVAQPSTEELAAAERARKDKIETAQGDLQRDTDRLWRLYGARSMFGM